MKRAPGKQRRLLSVYVSAGLVSTGLLALSTTGCSLLATTMWIVDPNDVEAEYDGLAGNRVAVICETSNSLPFNSYTVPNELAVAVTRLLDQNVSRIDLVSQAEISDWTDHNELKSYRELGEAMQAEQVVVINLNDFRIRKGSTMLQGQADVNVEIYDVATGEIAYELSPIHSVYPPNNGIPADLSQRNHEDRFRYRFTSVLANQIARRFYEHDSREDVKTDRFYKE